MKIAILSCFYPFRGGIAQFNAALYSQLSQEHRVKAFNFIRQYPKCLFPGTSQYVTKEDEAVNIPNKAVLDTINPISWHKTIKEIEAYKPDLLLIDYWMSWFAPSLGYISKRLNKRIKKVSILHNVIPHEPRFFDKPLTKYFLSAFDGHIVLSEEVGKDLLRLSPKAKYVELFHPIYSHFGEKMPREEAAKILGIDATKRTLLFFGLIRDYKGLDILIKAFSMLDDSFQLIIAGEPYGSFEKYQNLIDQSKAKDRIFCYCSYIKDSEVSKFFSASDLVVLPYRSATQSGVSAIAYHFEIPLIVTDVGGLKESIGAVGTGLVAKEAEANCIKKEINKFFADEKLITQCKISIRGEKERLSWQYFGRCLEEFTNSL